jgi:natural product precursor
MKKINGKLSLNKETIAKLNDDEMNSVKGGLAKTRAFCFASKGKNCDTSRHSCSPSICIPLGYRAMPMF